MVNIMNRKLLIIKNLLLVAGAAGLLTSCATAREWFFSPDELDEGALVIIENEAQPDTNTSEPEPDEFADDGSGQYSRDDALYDPLGYGDNYVLRENGEIVLMPTVREVSIDTSQVERLLYRSAQHIEDSRRFFYAGQYEEALYEVNAALELTPRSATGYAIKGSIEYKRGNIPHARAAWSVALQLDPSLSNIEQMLALLDQ